jgi:hypothetical protein
MPPPPLSPSGVFAPGPRASKKRQNGRCWTGVLDPLRGRPLVDETALPAGRWRTPPPSVRRKKRRGPLTRRMRSRLHGADRPLSWTTAAPCCRGRPVRPLGDAAAASVLASCRQDRTKRTDSGGPPSAATSTWWRNDRRSTRGCTQPQSRETERLEGAGEAPGLKGPPSPRRRRNRRASFFLPRSGRSAGARRPFGTPDFTRRSPWVSRPPPASPAGGAA